jgi:hypothetical protein
MIWTLLSWVGVIGTIVGTLFAACWPLLMKHFLKFETFVVKNREVMENISERISSTGWCATWVATSKQMPSGLCFILLKGGDMAWFWIGASGGDSDTSDFRVICSKAVFSIISKPRSTTSTSQDATCDGNGDGDDNDEDNNFRLVDRTGPYTWIGYAEGIVPWVPEPRDWQIEAMESILSVYNSRSNHNNATILVTSAPGRGKSTIAMQVAKHLKTKFCMSFNPTDPGDSFTNLIRETRPTATTPLVILLDEVDQMLLEVHTGKVQKHKNIHTEVTDKRGWCGMLDYVANQSRFVILIMTSNMSRSAITAMMGDDHAYLRDGRVHLCIESV